ncbi:hypothetical protein [Paenibacillus sp.]|jgi:uncharacterized membrane protein|uniref:hypothetical protein n=1 Tax=Paenibacillus sp. TaxID=58172 RepID=UPI00282614F6|nr:hypothetical protein [Paenibacillus sp.]MDR0269608.1 hypothetical protein [Paenibacillus sp.]
MTSERKGEKMKDWVTLLTAIIQFITAILLLRKTREENKKGTKKRRDHRKRK